MNEPTSSKPALAVVDETALSKDIGELQSHSDLTYRSVDGLKLAGVDLTQSLLTGTLLRGTEFTDINLSRCDLDGMRMEGAVFRNCSFRNVDFRSSSVVRGYFYNCDFSEALVSDCSFAESTFDGVSFAQAAVNECSFEDCALERCNIRMSSFLQNRFAGSRIADMALGDCTFLYCVMKRCAFEDVKVNAESLGMIFGLDRRTVAGMGLIYLGRAQDSGITEETLPALLQEYRRRRWNLGVAVMRMNFGVTSSAYALNEYLRELQTATEQGALLKRDELQFFGTVLEELAADGALPLGVWIRSTEVLGAMAARFDEASADNVHMRALLLGLHSRLIVLGARLLDHFEEHRLPISEGDHDAPVRITFRFAEKPQISLAELLDAAGSVAELSVGHASTTIETRAGSYVEVVKTTLFSVAALQMFLYLLNGCIVQLTVLRARTQVLAKKQLPPQYASLALQPRQHLPPFVAAAMQKLLGHVTVLPWLEDPHLKGYDTANLLGAEVEQMAEKAASPQGEQH